MYFLPIFVNARRIIYEQFVKIWLRLQWNPEYGCIFQIFSLLSKIRDALCSEAKIKVGELILCIKNITNF